MFAIIRRAFKYLNAETFIPLYKSLVRLQLGYVSSVWAPYRKKHTNKIEQVQKRATKQILVPEMKNLKFFNFESAEVHIYNIYQQHLSN
jgi:hypothetical protein